MQKEITELRNQVRTLKRIVYGFGCLLVAGIVVGATSLQTVPDVIQAKKFQVVNDEGKVIVQLSNLIGGGVDNGMLVTRNSAGQTLVVLGANEDGGNFAAFNKDGKLACLLTAIEDGGMLDIFNKDGNRIVGLVANEDGGSLVTLDKEGQITSQLPNPKTSEESCCQHPHHLECIVNTTSASPGDCQHSHHLECGVTTIK